MSDLNGLLQRAGALANATAEANQNVGQVGQLQRLDSTLTPSMAITNTIQTAKGHNGGFGSFGEFARSVRVMSQPDAFNANAGQHYKQKMAGWRDQYENRYKLNSPLGMNESFQGADGGALVPPEFVAQILMRLYANDLMSRTSLFPLSGNSIKIPAVNETSRADGSRFGGVTSYWRREAGSLTASKPSLMTVDLSLDSLFVFMRVTQEMLEDTGGALEVFLTQIAAQELAFKIGDSIINGDGVGKPMGILNAACTVSQAAEAAQTAATIVSANVLKMYSRLHVSSRANAVWIYDQSIEPSLFTMTIGTAGAQLAMYMPPGGLSGTMYSTLMGRPMIPVEFCQQLGTVGDIILADLSQYLMATKGGIQTAVSMHLYFDTNEMAFRFVVRLDGRPWWIAPLTPKSGGPTQSCFITLATRS
ncbi:MAG: phage major capsid protein [Gemmataceae bacterium]|nr:phage major capsid protein [Gemmataceae bacterium]